MKRTQSLRIFVRVALLLLVVVLTACTTASASEKAIVPTDRYLQMRAQLRQTDPDNPLFSPETWVYLDPGLGFEDEDGAIVQNVAREARLKAFATTANGHKKKLLLTTSEDPGFGSSNWQIDWSKLVVVRFRVSIQVRSYYTARITLGKSHGYKFGPLQPDSPGIGFMLYAGPFYGYQIFGIAHNAGPDIDGHESVFKGLPSTPGIDYTRNVLTLTVVSFGDGAMEWLLNDSIPLGYVASGGPNQAYTPAQPGYSVQFELSNDDAADDSNFSNTTDLSINGVSVYVHE